MIDCLNCPFVGVIRQPHEIGMPFCNAPGIKRGTILAVAMDGDSQTFPIPDWCPLPITVDQPGTA